MADSLVDTGGVMAAAAWNGWWEESGKGIEEYGVTATARVSVEGHAWKVTFQSGRSEFSMYSC